MCDVDLAAREQPLSHVPQGETDSRIMESIINHPVLRAGLIPGQALFHLGVFPAASLGGKLQLLSW